jgi:hypothetical protein
MERGFKDYHNNIACSALWQSCRAASVVGKLHSKRRTALRMSPLPAKAYILVRQVTTDVQCEVW